MCHAQVECPERHRAGIFDDLFLILAKIRFQRFEKRDSLGSDDIWSATLDTGLSGGEDCERTCSVNLGPALSLLWPLSDSRPASRTAAVLTAPVGRTNRSM